MKMLALCLGSVVTSMLISPVAAGSDPLDAVRERPRDPFIARPRQAPPGSPRSVVAGIGSFHPAQVNVDVNGANIPGDAANEPSIAVDPTAPNRIAIGWRQFDTIASDFRQAGWGYSRDGGRSWTFPGVIEPGIFRSDPVLDFASDGTFYYNSLTVAGSSFTCQLFASTDGGATWGPSADAFGGDKAWMAVDRTGGFGDGNIYSAWSTAAACCGFATWCRSIDGGASFQTPLDLAESVRFGTMTVGPDGAQYTAGIQSSPYDPNRILCVRSSNAADPGQTPVFDLTADVDLGGGLLLGDGPNPSGLLGQVDIEVDGSGGPNDGHVYMLASVNRGFIDALDVMFVRSEDGGQTWSTPVRVNDDPLFNGAWQWFGMMSIAPNGRLDAVWNDTRFDPAEDLTQLYTSSSTDGGVTWSPNVALTVPWDPSLGYPQQQKIGDYYDMISDDVGAHVAFAATLNGEQDVYYLRIGDYDCNANGIGDAQDLASGANDCDGNGIPDSCEIAAGAVADANGNGIPDACEANCPADVDGNGDVGFSDVLTLIAAWGPCPGCRLDLNGNGAVDFADILIVIGAWGACP